MILAADSEDPDQTAHERSLIWVLAVRACPEETFSLCAANIKYINIYHCNGKFTDGKIDDIFFFFFSFFFFFFFQKTEFDTSCKLSVIETICIICQNLFFLER